jgi:hypothetical protein
MVDKPPWMVGDWTTVPLQSGRTESLRSTPEEVAETLLTKLKKALGIKGLREAWPAALAIAALLGGAVLALALARKGRALFQGPAGRRQSSGTRTDTTVESGKKAKDRLKQFCRPISGTDYVVVPENWGQGILGGGYHTETIDDPQTGKPIEVIDLSQPVALVVPWPHPTTVPRETWIQAGQGIDTTKRQLKKLGIEPNVITVVDPNTGDSTQYLEVPDNLPNNVDGAAYQAEGIKIEDPNNPKKKINLRVINLNESIMVRHWPTPPTTGGGRIVKQMKQPSPPPDSTSPPPDTTPPPIPASTMASPDDRFEGPEQAYWYYLHLRDKHREAHGAKSDFPMKNAERDPRFKEWISQASDDEKAEFQSRKNKSHEFKSPSEEIVRISNSATSDYMCHEAALRSPEVMFQKPNPDDPAQAEIMGPSGRLSGKFILQSPKPYGFEEVSTLQGIKSDALKIKSFQQLSSMSKAELEEHCSKLTQHVAVIYSNKNLPGSHSARVIGLNPNAWFLTGDDVYLLSKSETNSLFIHKLGTGYIGKRRGVVRNSIATAIDHWTQKKSISNPNFFRETYGNGSVRLFRKVD